MKVGKKIFKVMILAMGALIPGVVLAAADIRTLEISCENLINLKLPHTEIRSAWSVTAGDFRAPDSTMHEVPAFCRVYAVARPTPKSDIQFEVWMPLKGWNGRYHQVASGGSAGNIPYLALAGNLATGAATAITDTGHRSDNMEWRWALNEPEKIIDYGYRGNKETSDGARAIIEAFYNDAPKYTYFSGCSRGGLSSLAMAQRYPDEWDGILIGAAPDNLTPWQFGTYLRNQLVTYHNPKAHIPTSKLPLIQKTALAACTSDAQVVDGIAADPRFCRYDPAVLICKGGDNINCLTEAQVHTLRDFYNGPIDPETGKNILPGFPPTMEVVQKPGNSHGNVSGILRDFYGSFVFDDLQWNPRTVKPDEVWTLSADKKVLGEQLDSVLGAQKVDWESVRKNGTKVLMYTGWADGGVNPISVIKGFENTVDEIGSLAATQRFLRLFMAPGMGHCISGPGADSFGQFRGKFPKWYGDPAGLSRAPKHDIMAALEAWVEKGRVPQTITAVKYSDKVETETDIAFTSLLCPYPQIAKYKGTGDTKDAANFVCASNPSPPLHSDLRKNADGTE